MKTIITLLMLLLCLKLTYSQEETHQFINMDEQQQQQPVNNQREIQPNFDGNFDSIPEPLTSGQQQMNQGQEGEGEAFEDEQKDMLQFSEHMGDFIPDQTFTFIMDPYSEQTFLLWPHPNVQSIRGMFHSEIEDVSIDSYVSLVLYDNQKIVRQYKQQRLGIFNINHSQKDHRYTFKFQSTDSQVQIYFSYEEVTSKKRMNKQGNGTTQFQNIGAKFQRVSRLIAAQESEMIRLISVSEKHQQKIQKYLQSLQFSIILQTVIMIFGSIFSLFLLRKQLYAGYELLV